MIHSNDIQGAAIGLIVGAVLVLIRCIVAAFREGVSVWIARSSVLIGVYAWAIPLVPVAILGCTKVPAVLVIFLILGVLHWRNRSGGFFWSHGTARWADTSDMLPLINRPDGLILGKAPPVGIIEALRLLRRSGAHLSGQALKTFLAAVGKRPLWVSTTDFTHGMAVMPAGKGKSTGLVIPFLQNCHDSCVVIDIKGELYHATHKTRRAMGRVVILDPFNASGLGNSDRLNVLSLIDETDPQALDQIRALAEAIVTRTGEEKEPHWNDMAELWIGAVIAYVVAEYKPADRNLQTVSSILSSIELLAKARLDMLKSKAFGGMLARMAGQLGHQESKELSSTLSTVSRHLRFLSTQLVAANTTSSTWDPRDIGKPGVLTVYLCLPPDKLLTQSSLLRLWITAMLQQVVASGLKQRRKIRFVLDEVAALGRMQSVTSAICQLRGYGLSVLTFWQSLGQLRSIYPNGEDQTFLSNNDVQIYGGINDFATAEQVSKQLGASTILVDSVNDGTTRATNYNPQSVDTTSTTTSAGTSTQAQQRDLMQPAELLRLHEREMVVFHAGVPPMLLRQVRHYDPEFKNRPRHQPLWRTALACFVFAVGSVALAAFTTVAMARELDAPRSTLPQQPQPKGLLTAPQKPDPWNLPRPRVPTIRELIEQDRREVEDIKTKEAFKRADAFWRENK